MASSKNISTPAARARLKPRRDPYWAKIRTGLNLGYRRSKDGGTWIARLAQDGRYTFRSLGAIDDYEDAIAACTAWARAQSDGEAQAHGYTVRDALEDYLADLGRRKGPDAATRARQSANKWIVPQLGKVKLSRLTKARIERWLGSMVPADADPETIRKRRDSANRILAIAKASWNHAFRNISDISDDAWRRVKPYKAVGARRKVFLSPKQAEALVKACEPSFGLLVRAALLTGSRYGELAAAKVGDLDLGGGVWHIPAAKTGARDAILSPKAVTFFKRQIKAKAQDDHVFLRADGHPWGKSHQFRPLRDAVKAAKLDPATTFYALRHSYVSRALLAGLPMQVIADNLGTSPRMLEQHYAHFLKRDRQQLLARVDL